MSHWLKRFTMRSVEHLATLNAAAIAQLLPSLEPRSLTVDVDGTVVPTGLTVERAERRYNPHYRKCLSYYPITAHLAETTHVLRVRSRSGNVHDGAVFRDDVLHWLSAREAGYTLKVPVYRQLDLFDPDDGHYEYSAITSNLDYTLGTLWHLVADRGAHEKTIAQLIKRARLIIISVA